MRSSYHNPEKHHHKKKVISKKLKNIIIRKLVELEEAEKVKVLYACESGSRAWGFASVDSDYDVRFIYAHHFDHYLSIKRHRDVIERPIENQFDISGWDIRKALRLFRKGNPPLLEWLGSPIVYMEHSQFAESLRSLLVEFYNPRACAYHYLHMAQGNFRTYLKGDTVWVKKYFYVLRPVLAIKWLECGYGVVPTEFTALLDRIIPSSSLKLEIERLLELKREGEELDYGPRINAISEFIEKELTRLDGIKFEFEKHIVPTDRLDDLFRRTLEEVWGVPRTG